MQNKDTPAASTKSRNSKAGAFYPILPAYAAYLLQHVLMPAILWELYSYKNHSDCENEGSRFEVDKENLLRSVSTSNLNPAVCHKYKDIFHSAAEQPFEKCQIFSLNNI